MSLENIQLTITLSDSKLEDDRLQEDTRNILSEVKKFDGVQKADLMSIETAEPGAMGIGGFLVGILTAEINIENTKGLVKYLGNRLYGKTIKMKITAKGNGQEIEVEIEGCNAKELEKEYEKVKPIIEKIVNG
ncbi:MAG: hypothetical protein F6K22_17980 [Okeania sp. SIO2F4]|uniref:hypothetical protein n=1 Tax=Okeania sp. SIO2F4 TaxID=2607790 RepID=UPI00142A5E82|nr:hypothetical protein [Okeania sp. SIO2F4]NES04551.1 hypothetical protein [Okeania sp. SIO2F4]